MPNVRQKVVVNNMTETKEQQQCPYCHEPYEFIHVDVDKVKDYQLTIIAGMLKRRWFHFIKPYECAACGRPLTGRDAEFIGNTQVIRNYHNAVIKMMEGEDNPELAEAMKLMNQGGDNNAGK